jgi:prepilin-type N-terminal cleavage/methylation domain-containing protein
MGVSGRGFSLLELVVAMAIALALMAATFRILRASRASFEAGAERADVQQRLRVGSDTLDRDLSMAGAGASIGPGSGPLLRFLAPVWPSRLPADGDTPGTARTDTITTVAVREDSPQATLAVAMPAASADAVISDDAGCPVGDASCGFVPDTTVLVYDADGSFDLFRVDAVSGSVLTLTHLGADGPAVHPSGSRIAEVMVRTYFLDRDATSGSARLARQDIGGNVVPIVDHLVGLAFEYYGDALPPAGLSDPVGGEPPWTPHAGYGPGPPPAGTTWSAYPPGENCSFRRGAAGALIPRLAILTPDGRDGLARLRTDQLDDGPWCPDGSAPNAFDADLLRIRRIRVTVRFEAAVASLRGAGGLFANPGTATSAAALVPDRLVQFDVAPRNLAASQ